MRRLAGAALTGALLIGAGGGVADADVSRPSLTFSNPNVQSLLGPAYSAALKNLLDTNTVPYDPGTYDQAGLMSDPPGTFIRAGGGYPQPWTRDASINSWNAASVLEPDAAANTLWSVVRRQGDGRLIVVQDDQWWDQVVWITSAWHHYLVTGDRRFLANAYETATDTLAVRKAANYNATYGLFEGMSFFNDGIAGYPSPPADATESHGSGVFTYPNAEHMMVLSTNELYYAAYRSAAHMARALGEPHGDAAADDAMADSLRREINRHFWIPAKGRYGYLIHNGDSMSGALDESQEGTGTALALLFGIADRRQAQSIMRNVHIQPWGIVDVYPHFPRYDDQHPGRHNVIVWPMVQGFWASAAARNGDQLHFAEETSRLARLADSSSGFWEIYNSLSGVVDGGWQSGFHWGSQPDQTWSATAYLRMMYDGVFGIRHTARGLRVAPTLPVGWGDATLTGFPYRDATLDVTLRGSGNVVRSFKLDGHPTRQRMISPSLSGHHTVDIELTGGRNADRDADGVPDAADQCPDRAGVHRLGGCPDPSDLQAEDALSTGGATTNDNHAGFTGRAFLDGYWNQGAATTFTVHRTSAGTSRYTATLRYANGNDSSRSLTLYVNGEKLRRIDLPPTGSWDAWSTEREPVTLTGKADTITYRYDPGDGGNVNLDKLSVQRPSGTG